jgi:hypothetical protein
MSFGTCAYSLRLDAAAGATRRDGTVGALSTPRRRCKRLQRVPHHRWQRTARRAAVAPQHEALTPRHAVVGCFPEPTALASVDGMPSSGVCQQRKQSKHTRNPETGERCSCQGTAFS